MSGDSDRYEWNLESTDSSPGAACSTIDAHSAIQRISLSLRHVATLSSKHGCPPQKGNQPRYKRRKIASGMGTTTLSSLTVKHHFRTLSYVDSTCLPLSATKRPFCGTERSARNLHRWHRPYAFHRESISLGRHHYDDGILRFVQLRTSLVEPASVGRTISSLKNVRVPLDACQFRERKGCRRPSRKQTEFLDANLDAPNVIWSVGLCRDGSIRSRSL